MTQGTSDVVTGNSLIGTAGTLNGAGLTTVSLSNLNLFAGSGGTLNEHGTPRDGKGTRLNSTHAKVFNAAFCLEKKAVVRPAGLTGPTDKTAYTGLEMS